MRFSHLWPWPCKGQWAATKGSWDHRILFQLLSSPVAWIYCCVKLTESSSEHESQSLFEVFEIAVCLSCQKISLVKCHSKLVLADLLRLVDSLVWSKSIDFWDLTKYTVNKQTALWLLWTFKMKREFNCSWSNINLTVTTRISRVTWSPDQPEQMGCDMTMSNSIVTLKDLSWFVNTILGN